MKIWKQNLERKRVQDIAIPTGAEILSVGYKDDAATLWFRCDPDAAPKLRRIEICYTGVDDTPEKSYAVFLGTIIKPDGIVLHIFEIPFTDEAPPSSEYR